MIKSIFVFLSALPELIKLIRNIEKRLNEQAIEKKVKDEIKIINQAFKDKDAKSLNDLFNS